MKHLLKSLLVLALLTVAARAAGLVNVSGATGIALDGHDPVAFFTDHKPVHGNPGIKAQHDGATYLFASETHRDLFQAAPEKYVPQFGGYCAYGVSVGALFPVDIDNWQIRDGKLYLNLNDDIAKAFNADLKGNLQKARQNWPALAASAQSGTACEHCSAR